MLRPFKQGTSNGTIREFFKKTRGLREALDPFMGTGMTALIVGSCLADLPLCCGDSHTYPGECVRKCLHRPNSIVDFDTDAVCSHENKSSIKSEESRVEVESKWAPAQ